MIIADTALQQREREGNPIKIALIGAGFMGRAVARCLLRPLTGMRLLAIGNRTVANAEKAYGLAGYSDAQVCGDLPTLEGHLGSKPVIASDPLLLCEAGQIDVVVEVTGQVDFGAKVAMRAIEHGKHVVFSNAEVDATVGPILKFRATRAGLVVTNTDGDEPGVAMNLIRFARSLGYEPVCAGNLKGLLDHYRTPDTQREFAKKNQQRSENVTAFADGTKMSMEAAILANASGFSVQQRGMRGYECGHVTELLQQFTEHDFAAGGLIEFVVGAAPYTGAFVLARCDDPCERSYMSYFKMGDGPLYCFYTPYHLPHLQIADSIARAVLFGDATVTPIDRPRCEVITMAKRDLKAGDTLDGLGGFCAYGSIDNADVAVSSGLLPMGVSEGATVKHDLPKDHAIRYSDVTLPPQRLVDLLREEQNRVFLEA